MKQKTMSFSVLFTIFILIICFFIWTAGAAGNPENKIKNSCNAIENKGTQDKNTDSTTGSAIYAATSSVDDSDTPVEDAVLPVTEEDVPDPADDISDSTDNITNINDDTVDANDDTVDVNDDVVDTADGVTDAIEDTNNITSDIDNTSAEANNMTDGINSPIDETNDILPANTENLTDVENNTFENTSEIIDDDYLGDSSNLFDDANNSFTEGNSSIDETNSSINSDLENETYNQTDDDNNSIDNTDDQIDNSGSPIDDTDNLINDDNNSVDTKPLELTVNEPSSESVCTNNVLFNFSAIDKLDDNLTYTLYINGAERSAGPIAKDECKEVEINLDDGHYSWEITIKDSLGNIRSNGPNDLYVATKLPVLTLISPEDGLINTGDPLNFSFSADVALDAQNKDQNLTYNVDIDGDEIGGLGSGTMHPKGCIQTQNITNLSDGVHEWCVSIDDDAGNNVNESRTFYVNRKGLRVSLISPNKENVSTRPEFKFRVSGGSGLFFKYKLLVDGEEVKKSTCEGSDNKTLEVGEDFSNDYSIKASVPDGEDKMWTVNITDCAGNSYEPEPYHFSLDTTGPGRIVNLSVRDAPSETLWSCIRGSPALFVSWDAKSGGDLASTPYDVFISDSEPLSIEDMEKVKSITETRCLIEKYNEEPLVYGKDYWVAVIARDKSGNYNKCFVAVCGPVQAYEDMNITLEPGWNMKSVPKRLLESNLSPESVFGKNSTVLYWTGASWEVPETIEPCKGYWVYSPVAFQNNVEFKPNMLDNESDSLAEPLNLSPGWHMIGSTSLQPAEWSTILASLENSNADYKFSNLITYSCNEGWNGLVPGILETFPVNVTKSVTSSEDLINDSDPRPVGMLQNEGVMVPGQGYWIYVDEEGTYIPSESDGVDADVPVDESVSENEIIGEENAGNMTTDMIGADNETAVEEGVDENSTDETVTDVGTDDNLVVDEENPEKPAANFGTAENTTDDEDSNNGNNVADADEVPVSD